VKYYGRRSINSLILFRVRNNCQITGTSPLLYQLKRSTTKLAVVAIVGHHFYQLHTKFYRKSFSLLTSPYIVEIIGDHQRGFRHNRSTYDQIFCIRQILEKKRHCNETVQQLFIDIKKAYNKLNSVRREVLYSILIELGVPVKLVRLIKMCLNERCSKSVWVKCLSDNFHLQNGLRERDAVWPEYNLERYLWSKVFHNILMINVAQLNVFQKIHRNFKYISSQRMCVTYIYIYIYIYIYTHTHTRMCRYARRKKH
jgi:hypothetical protein